MDEMWAELWTTDLRPWNSHNWQPSSGPMRAEKVRLGSVATVVGRESDAGEKERKTDNEHLEDV